MATATALTQFFLSMGGAIGIAVYGTILVNELTINIATLPPDIQLLTTGILENLTLVQTLPPYV